MAAGMSSGYVPQPASLETYYRNMAEQWREQYVALQEENGLLRKRAPSAPGLYRARLDERGDLVVERVMLSEGGAMLDAAELPF